MEKTDVLIIGAGAVGLAVARELAGRPGGASVIVVERHASFGQETSSRNSEVVHAGIYYPAGSLKARLCVRGRVLLYEFLEKYDVPYSRLGKLIVAADAAEEPLLADLHAKALANGVGDAALISGAEARAMEPAIAAAAALHSPSTGIFDSHAYMKVLESQARERGADFAYGCEVSGLARTSGGWQVRIRDADGSVLEVLAETVVNCGGLHADRVAALAGIDLDRADYRLHLSKGEYFKVHGLPRRHLQRLVYPVPGTTFLGIHIVLDLSGGIRLGPNAAYADAIDYTVNPDHASEFFEAAHRYLPGLKKEMIAPDMAGMRAKLQKPGEVFRDFVISDEAGRGLSGLVSCVGIESPGLTSSLAIAEYVHSLI
jgi:L-2-hydroxyglutarate oxidase LhgO